MAVLEARYRVRDRNAFMDAFSAFRPVRVEMGITGCRLLGGVDDPSVVVVMFDLPSPEAARAYAADPRRADALRNANVEAVEDVVLEELLSASV